MKKTLYSLIIAASLPVMVQTASAAVLFTDNFTVLPGGVGNQDVNQLLGSGRQTGPLASVSSGFFSTYTFGGDHHQVGNTTTDVGQPGGAANSAYVLLALDGGTFQSDLDIANVSTGPLTVEVDMYNNGSNPGGGLDTQWVALTLGVPGNTGPNSGGTGEFGFLKRANGGVQVFQNGADIAAGALDVIGTATADHWTVTFDNGSGGSAFNGTGSRVVIQNGATVLGTYILNQLKSSGLRLGFKCDGNRYAGIANLKVSGTLAPAPALAVLFHDNFGAYYGLNADANLNLNVDLVDRQTGLLAPMNYTPVDNHHQVGNAGTAVGQPFGAANSEYVLTAFNGDFYSDLDIPVISTGPLKVELDMYVNSNDWLALGLCHVPNNFFPIVTGSGEFGFLRQSDGGLQFFQNNSGITPSGWNNAGFAPNSHMTFIFTDTAGTGSAFNGNGSKVTVMSSATTLGTVTLTQLSSSGLKLGFHADGGELGGIDNLTISGTAPAVIAPNLVTDLHPLRSEVTTGTPMTLSVTAGGTPLNYQWYNQSGPISGATSASYSFNAVAGTSSYHVAITNTAGSIVSSTGVVISAANLVTVNNFSFENGYTVAFGDGGIPVQWTSYNGDWSGVSGTTGQFSPAIVPDGTQYYAVNTGPGHSGASGAYQDVGPLQPDTTYTLTVAIGRGDNNGVPPNGLGDWSPGIISLLNGTDNTGTVLASTTGYPATPGTWQDYTATFTTGPTVSGDLVIELGVDPASTWQSLFDNVRLTVGAPTAVLAQTILPAQAETFVGDQMVFTAAYNDTPTSTLQWVHIGSGPVTNLVNTGVLNVDNAGVTTSTLTISSVQLSDAGSYVLEAINATNSAAIAYSPAAQLVVSTPVAVGNVLQKNSAQAASYPYYPAWTINTSADLIYQFGSSGAGSGNFTAAPGLASDPAVLTDGILGDDFPNLVSCGWVNSPDNPGQSITYGLPASPHGYEVTNITVYGGWSNDGRNELKYQVLYSTVAAPAAFVSLGTFDYNPAFNNNVPNANRCILIPVSGVLAHNVANVQINFNMQSKNNWNGYSEITVGGTQSVGVLPALTQDVAPNTAEDVMGGQLILTGAFTGATSYQWQKNGTNLVGQTTNILTLNNLQLTDTATNGGYRLLGINVAGTNATRGCTVVVDPAPVAVGNVVTAVAYQTADTTISGLFTPTWSTNQVGASLIAGQNPPALGSLGDFVLAGAGNDQAGGLPVLTDGNYGYFYFDTTHPAFACGGPDAGEIVTYTLGSNPNGYNVTNIQIAGGWDNNGRDSQYYTVSYSTVANPTMFSAIALVQNNLFTPGYGVNDATAVRTTFTPAAGVLASNVYAIQVDFTYPVGVPYNHSGYSEISVFGSASATAPPAGPVITTQHEETTFDYVLETPNLIANQLPSTHGPGVFTGEGCTEAGLTDGILSFGGNANSGACGSTNGPSVQWIVFSSTNAAGWDLTDIVTYTLWHDYGRDGQFYNLSYSTVANPTTFLPLTSVSYNPYVAHTGTPSANRVQISPAIGQTLLASNVTAVKFDFTPQGNQDYAWSGYSEIVLQGINLAPLTPPIIHPAYVSGGNLILTGSGGTPNHAYTWLTTTNLAAPITWTTNSTGVLDGSGAFSNAIPINPSLHDSFFKLRLP